MKVLEEKAYQIYKVSSEYTRFDQKYNLARRGKWDSDWTGWGQDALKNRVKRVDKGLTGYNRKDWALHQAVWSSRRVAKTVISAPNRGHTSWASVGAKLAPSAMGPANESPQELSRDVHRAARLMGADLVGFTKLDRRWIYSRWFDDETNESYPIKFSDEVNQEIEKPVVLENRTQVIPKSMNNVVVMVIEMDELGMASAPTMTEFATVHRAYSQLSTLTLGVAEFIRALGYTAIPMVNDTGLNVPLAIDAGLGQLGRHGLLITPLFGPRCRICKVLTDMPLENNWPIDFGVTAFCEVCKKCAEHCPANAISKEERRYEVGTVSCNPGALKWERNVEACRKYQGKIGTNCGICIRVCPFNKSRHWSHAIVRWLIANVPFFDPFIVRMDDMVSYGKFKDPETYFWNS